MILCVECGEAYVMKDMPDVYDSWKNRKSLGYVGGAEIRNGDKIVCRVSGSDEYGFMFHGVKNYRIKRGSRYKQRTIIANIKESN